MIAKRRLPRRFLGSDLKRVDAHAIQSREYDELPKLTEEMLARGKVKRGGQTRNTLGAIQGPKKNKN